MANYTNKYFEEYVPEDSVKEAILCQNPVPYNLDNVKKLDDFLPDILKEKRKTNERNIENVLEKLQRKTVDVMGPLSKLWNILEGAKGAEEDAVQISIYELLHYTEQTVLQKHDEYLFGKSFKNHIAGTIKSKKQTKDIFIEHTQKALFI